MKKSLLLLTCLPLLVWAKPKDLYWEDMVPQGYQAPDQIVNHDGTGNSAQMSVDAPVVAELNGQEVRIPGFVVPLEGDDEKLTEFLLVPYFGACIHVPPPPPNQIVHVTFAEGAPVENLQDAVWITGTLSTQGWSGDIATVGYSLQGIKIEPYDG